MTTITTYKTLTDAAHTSPVLAVGDVKIHYLIGFSRNTRENSPRALVEELKMKYGMGFGLPRTAYGENAVKVAKENFENTHTCIGSIKGGDFETIFGALQGENWSPEGEARDIIGGSGTQHTSMSVGDVIETADNEFYIVAPFGFEKIW